MTLLDLNDANLDADPKAVLAIKRPIDVAVHFATEAGTIETLEGPVTHEAGAAILRGVRGELWPLAAARFRTLYEPSSGTVAGRDGTYRKRPVAVRAKQILDGPFTVRVGTARQPITGRAGDWLIQYSSAKRSVISDEVFRASYEVMERSTDVGR